MKITTLLLLILFCSAIIASGCSDCETLGNETIDRLMKNEPAMKDVKQQNPQNINLYVDVSSSMQNYLDPVSASGSGKLYENFIRSLFAAKQDASFNLYGFGDSLHYLGDKSNAVASLLDKKTYGKSSSRINLAFDKIKADTTNSLNIVLSDAIYEDKNQTGNELGFLIGPYFKDQMNKEKLFALIAGKYSYFSTVLKKLFDTPLYMFVFGSASHTSFVYNNLVPIGENSFVLSPSNEMRPGVTISQNADLNISSDKYKGVEVNDNSTPVQFDVKLERNLPNHKTLESAAGEKYKMNIYMTSFRCVNGNRVMDEWKEVQDLKTEVLNKFTQDSSKQIFSFKFSRSFPESEIAYVYKFVISQEIPTWIIDKYSSTRPEEMEKTYRFTDFFTTLQNHLKEKPVSLYTYYLIVE